MAGKGENTDAKSTQPNVERVESAVRESSTTFISELNSITGPSGSGRKVFSQLEKDGYSGRAEALEGTRILDAVKGAYGNSRGLSGNCPCWLLSLCFDGCNVNFFDLNRALELVPEHFWR
jgi:hypothetical protein